MQQVPYFSFLLAQMVVDYYIWLQTVRIGIVAIPLYCPPPLSLPQQQHTTPRPMVIHSSLWHRQKHTTLIPETSG